MMQFLLGYESALADCLDTLGFFIEDTTYSKPMWVWMRMRPMKRPSSIGFSEPAAKGAMVIGRMAMETALP